MYRALKIAVLVTGIVLTVLCALLVREYYLLVRERAISGHNPFSVFGAKHRFLSVSDASLIHSWMTFDYIDRSFGIPKEILKDRLTITDPHYPQLTIARYAAEKHYDQAEFLKATQTAVVNYLNGR